MASQMFNSEWLIKQPYLSWLLITWRGGWDLPSLEMMRVEDWLLIGAAPLIYIGCATYSITQPMKDAKKGIRQVGMIEVTSTFSAGKSNKARFGWLGGEESCETNLSGYGDFEPGDQAYLEYLPHSGVDLVLEKVEPEANVPEPE